MVHALGSMVWAVGGLTVKTVRAMQGLIGKKSAPFAPTFKAMQSQYRGLPQLVVDMPYM